MAFTIRPLTPVTFGVAFPQKQTEIGRELGEVVNKHKAKCARGPGVRASCASPAAVGSEVLGPERRESSRTAPTPSSRNIAFSDALYKS